MQAATTLLPTTLAFVAALTSASAAGAQPPPGTRAVIEIGNPDFRPYPIATPDVRDLSVPGSVPAQAMTKALRYDFEISPVFKLLDPRSYLADQAKEGMNAASIKFADWLSVGAEGLIKGSIEQVGGEMKVDLRFFDVASGREQLKKSYKGPATEEEGRTIGHRFANEVVFFLTGTKGIFTTRIAAVKKTKTGRELWTMNVDGTGRVQVTNNGSINLLPAWGRDGRTLLFTSYIKHNPNFYSMPAGGGALKLLSGERGLNTGGVMSPDGRKVALTLSRDGNSEIYVMNADGSGLTRLTNEWAIDSSPSWSPDGKRIAFVSARWGDPHVFVMNADGSGVRRITERGNYNQTPDWSPRGDLIAFTARDERNQFDIFTVNPDTKEIKRLTQDQGNNEEPSFSPDGNHIVFTSTRNKKSQVFIMATDGSHQTLLTQEGAFSTPAWSPYLD